LRCPRGLPLTEAIGRLKQIAARERIPLYKKGVRFYESFLSSVRRHGRVREMEFMTLYFMSMKNPFLPLKFSYLGIRLLGKGKVSVQVPSRGKRPLERLFEKVEELEAGK
jgi:heterodisulfide reductase subunit C